jgi:hypothetical protein
MPHNVKLSGGERKRMLQAIDDNITDVVTGNELLSEKLWHLRLGTKTNN